MSLSRETIAAVKPYFAVHSGPVEQAEYDAWKSANPEFMGISTLRGIRTRLVKVGALKATETESEKLKKDRQKRRPMSPLRAIIISKQIWHRSIHREMTAHLLRSAN